MRKNTEKVYRKLVRWADKAVDMAIEHIDGQGEADCKVVESALKVVDGAAKGLESGREPNETGIVLVHQVPRPDNNALCG